MPVLEPKAFALPKSHRTDNAVSPRQHVIYNVYKRTTQTLRCHSPVVMSGSCEVLGSQRQTFENAFYRIYGRPPCPRGLTERRRKGRHKSRTAKTYGRKKRSPPLTFPRRCPPPRRMTLPKADDSSPGRVATTRAERAPNGMFPKKCVTPSLFRYKQLEIKRVKSDARGNNCIT